MISLTGGTEGTHSVVVVGMSLFNGYPGSVWEHEEVLEMDGGDGCVSANMLQCH